MRHHGILVVVHRTPRSTTRCDVLVRAVRAVRCFGSRGAVFRDARGERTTRGVCGAVFRDTGYIVGSTAGRKDI